VPPSGQGWDLLEQVVERFENAWQRGEVPALDDYLPDSAADRRDMLVELVHADLECRLKAGMDVRAETYLARYPELGDDRRLALELITAEHELRGRRETNVGVGEYLQRFPQYADELAALLQSETRSFTQNLAGLGSLSPTAQAPAPAPIGSVQDLAEQIGAFGVLPPHQLPELGRLQEEFSDPRDLARELLQRGWLTPFQVNRLFQGRGHELLLGPYHFLERLGSGGMGQVFKARHEDLDQFLAVKLLRRNLSRHPLVVRRFRREIRAILQLAHPHVVLALDTGVIDGAYYFAMEYVEGIDLARLVKQFGPLPIHRACDYIRQAARGLQHAHERGMVHRDVKPSNLMLRLEDSVVKVLDLGLARLLLPSEAGERSSTLTQEGVIMGTPDYMAPEQTLDAHKADIRSDIYSLGCTLYYLLTGRLPFPGRNLAEKLLKHQVMEPRPVAELRPEVPPDLSAVLGQMLAKRPEDRYQTAALVAAALANLKGRR
jgi:serine/threonine-protein kinase